MRARPFIALVLLLSAVTGGLALAVSDGSTSCANAEGNACVAACRTAHSDCRIRTKGSPSCDAQFQACMRGCVKH